MQDTIKRSRRLRKKLHLDEFAIIGFAFTCRVHVQQPSDYEIFFKEFATLVNARHLYIDLEEHDGVFRGRVTSADRYGDATADDKEVLTALLTEHAMVRDVSVGELVDGYYDL